MKAIDHARSFYRSEAFPEDLSEFVEPAPKAALMPRRARSLSLLWLLGLLPLAALTVGMSWIV